MDQKRGPDAGERTFDKESPSGIDFEKGSQFWSFQPVREHPEPPRGDWGRTQIDAFVLEAMKQRGLNPSPPADRATLIRRLDFDLVGLPPTPEEVQKFVQDESPTAYERLVDRLLQSPQYGERWARFWLDKSRYADKTASWLSNTGEAYLYRDWVATAFNVDMPYDEFVHRQLATDLMPETGPEDFPALGFISLSPTYWKELKLPCEIIKVIVADEWEERVDAVSRTFLGLTVACARCHDHKFDPISSEDYYAWAGVFASCRRAERPLVTENKYAPVREAKEKVKKLEAERAALKKKKASKEEINTLTAMIEEIKAGTPGYDLPLANALSEESLFVVRAGKTPQDGTKLEYCPGPRDLPLFIRGDPNRPGEIIPRRFLKVLSRNQKPEPFKSGSGRLELGAITTDAAQNRFQGGNLHDVNGNDFEIISNTGTTITISTPVGPGYPLVQEGITTIRDDDEWQDGQDIPDPDTSEVGNAFAEAFVTVDILGPTETRIREHRLCRI